MIEEITPCELVQRRESGGAWQILDVRENWEKELAAVPGTTHIPMGEVAERLHELDASLPIAVMCHAGARSMKVAIYLAQNGFDKVVNISGGIDAWAVDVDSSIARY